MTKKCTDVPLKPKSELKKADSIVPTQLLAAYSMSEYSRSISMVLLKSDISSLSELPSLKKRRLSCFEEICPSEMEEDAVETFQKTDN